MIKRFFPILEDMSAYKRAFLWPDMNAALLVAVLLIPQGMAYAFLAGMPPVYGLYTALVPLFVYAIMGTTKKMSIGPVAISAILVLQGISQIAEPFSAEYIDLTLIAGLLIGVFHLLLGLFRIGFLANFISHPVISGFTSAAAIIIIINQLKDILGISIPRFKYTLETIQHAISSFANYNWVAISIFLSGLILMLILKKIHRKIPFALITVILSILVVKFLNLESRGLAIVGEINSGLPGFKFSAFNYDTFLALMPTVLTVGVIGVVESISIAKTLEEQGETVETNQELIALGLSKIIGSFFQSIPSSASFSRSAVNKDSGAKTQLSSVFASMIILLTLLFLMPLFYYLPKAILASIIVLAVFKLFDYAQFKYLWKSHRADFIVMLTTFLATLIIGIQEGVLIGVLLSLVLVLYRSSLPEISVLGRVPHTTYYRNIEQQEVVEMFDNTLIIRLENQLYFANASYFKKSIEGLVNDYEGDLKELILDAKSIHDIDSSGINALNDVIDYLENEGIAFKICGSMASFREQLLESGSIPKIGKGNIYPYLNDALKDKLS